MSIQQTAVRIMIKMFLVRSSFAGVELGLPVSLVALDVGVALPEDVAAAVTTGVAIGVISALGTPENGRMVGTKVGTDVAVGNPLTT